MHYRNANYTFNLVYSLEKGFLITFNVDLFQHKPQNKTKLMAIFSWDVNYGDCADPFL